MRPREGRARMADELEEGADDRESSDEVTQSARAHSLHFKLDGAENLSILVVNAFAVNVLAVDIF